MCLNKMNKDKRIKAILPKGFKDRSGYELALKKKLLNIIEKNFIKFGFSPLETTPMELSSIIGNSLAEDDENPMADIFKFDDSGTGISIGIDRLVFCLSQKEDIKAEEQKPVLICVMDPKYLDKYYEILNFLRKNNISSEIFLESKKKLTKQLEYCNRRSLSVAIICGENEFKDNTVTIKNLKGIKGENNKTIPKEDLINEVKKII